MSATIKNSTIKPVYINTLSIAAPSLIGLEQAMPVLTGKVQWQTSEFPKLVPQLLPANERRRITSYIKLALHVADEANLADKSLLAVFASSNGDFYITDHICRTLSMDAKHISPIQFHNSVHNAPSGYWAIAAKSQAASTSISTGESSFSSGLLEAVTQVLCQQQDVLFIAYDFPSIEPPLNKFSDVTEAFATAFVLSLNKSENNHGAIKLDITNNNSEKSHCINASLNELQNSNPIAEALPLLEALCLKNTTTLFLPYLNNSKLKIEVSQ
ncbi:MAG: beta-ketoacyl synthase chain length factor [Gammaproteobacteria bacterium]|nr:beta-ketoacyl synthase chain length factor [Gammaproteobacteria bacterium]